jgi:hypothetical protein
VALVLMSHAVAVDNEPPLKISDDSYHSLLAAPLFPPQVADALLFSLIYINGIESVEDKSIQGNGLLKLTFHPGTDYEPGAGSDHLLRKPRSRLRAIRDSEPVCHPL